MPKGIHTQANETFAFLSVTAMAASVASGKRNLNISVLSSLPNSDCTWYNYYIIILNFCLGIKFQSFLFQDMQNITKTTRLTMGTCQKSSLQQLKPHFILVGKLTLISGYFKDTETEQKQRRLKTQKR